MEQDKEGSELIVKNKKVTDEPKQHLIFKKYGKWILTVSMLLNIVGIGFYFQIARVQNSKFRVTSDRESTTTKVDQIQEKSSNSDSNILEDLKRLGSDVLVSDWETQYAVYVLRRYEPFVYSPYGKDGGNLMVYEDLIVLNLETGEKNVYDVYEKQLSAEMLSLLEGIPSEANFHADLELLRWSPFSKNTFWGKLSIYSYADPPIANEISYFKIDLNSSLVNNYTMPSHGLFGATNENTSANKVLYETVGEGLSLYLYDLESKEDRLIVAYDKDVFDTYCTSFLGYVHTFHKGCGRDRQLRAEWEEGGFSYFDFVTRERIVVKAD